MGIFTRVRASASGLPKRPVSVVLLQVLIVGLILAFVPPVLSIVYEGAPAALRHRPFGFSAWLAGMVAVVVLLVFILWALWYGKPYGRWLGLACIALLAGGLLHGYFDPPQIHADDPGEDAGFPWGRVTALFLLAWWFYALGFSRKARVFFAVEQKQEQA